MDKDSHEDVSSAHGISFSKMLLSAMFVLSSTKSLRKYKRKKSAITDPQSSSESQKTKGNKDEEDV